MILTSEDKAKLSSIIKALERDNRRGQVLVEQYVEDTTVEMGARGCETSQLKPQCLISKHGLPCF